MTDNKELTAIAVKFDKLFLSIQEAFLPNYYKDNRIALIDDCWKYVRGEFTKEEDEQFADNHLCGSGEKPKYNINAALQLIVDLYKEIFNEVIGGVVSEMAKATEKDFLEEEPEKLEENNLKDFVGEKIDVPILVNPFHAIVSSMLDWCSISEHMSKYDYAETDSIYMKAEQKKPLTNEEVEEYNKIMVPFVKKTFKDLGKIADSLNLSFIHHNLSKTK